jgi:LPXTG-site transpeptidase (sortase) family protein
MVRFAKDRLRWPELLRFAKGRHRRRPAVDIPLWLVAASLVLALVASSGASREAQGVRSSGSVPFATDVAPRGGRPPASTGAGTGKKRKSTPGTSAVATIGGGGVGYVSGAQGRFRVSIPTIGVEAPVIDLNLNADGSLEVPSDFRVTGWYAGGPEPGDIGPAVIVGHVDSRNGAAIFYRLDALAKGDKVDVFQGKRKMTFVVQSVSQYPKDDFPTSKVYGRVDYPALRLITCGGAFNSSTGHYTDNIVVFAKLA